MWMVRIGLQNSLYLTKDWIGVSSKNLRAAERYNLCVEADVLSVHLKVPNIHALVEDHL